MKKKETNDDDNGGDISLSFHTVLKIKLSLFAALNAH